jgi:hypothetical protein
MEEEDQVSAVVGSLVGFLVGSVLTLWFRHGVTKDWIRPLSRKVTRSPEYKGVVKIEEHYAPVLKVRKGDE